MASLASDFVTSPELSSLIERFIAKASAELGSHSTALQQTIQDYFVKQPRLGTAQFVLEAAAILRQFPNLVQELDLFLRHASAEETLHVVTSDSPSKQVELIVITSPSGGQIYELPGATLESDWTRVTSSEQLRIVLLQGHDFTTGIPSASWACALTELLQHEMRFSVDDAAYRTLCLRTLRRIIRKFDVFPPSFFIRDIAIEGNRPLSGGGFADVYRGSLKGEQVCLKVLRSFIQTMEMREKLSKDFCQEALVWKQLDHPNLLPFLGVTVELVDRSFSLVSPWMSNGTVMQYLEKNLGLDRLNPIKGIAAAVQYLHEHLPPIVHADIKDTNVLVLNNLKCCIADFGLSAIIESGGIAATSTVNQRGTVRWMAPETLSLSAHGAELKQTPRDIYVFGCTVLEIYTGKPPFSGYWVDLQVGQEVAAGRRPPRPLNLFSDESWNVIEECWQHDPTHRPSATMILTSLETNSVIQRHTLPHPLNGLDNLVDSVQGQDLAPDVTVADIYCDYNRDQ
ncbi:kinase-like domain-containing protein [Mycena floridula]|nr:kinase-like domain-containing protein [Mycena floridula]